VSTVLGSDTEDTNAGCSYRCRLAIRKKIVGSSPFLRNDKMQLIPLPVTSLCKNFHRLCEPFFSASVDQHEQIGLQLSFNRLHIQLRTMSSPVIDEPSTTTLVRHQALAKWMFPEMGTLALLDKGNRRTHHITGHLHRSTGSPFALQL
jgi:hypothetical protein